MRHSKFDKSLMIVNAIMHQKVLVIRENRTNFCGTSLRWFLLEPA